MKKRQIETGVLCGLFALLLGGCDMSGRSDGQLYQEPNVTTETSVAEEPSTTATEYPVSDQEEESMHSDVDEVVQKLGVGWNLGNALDAWDNSIEMGNIKNDTENSFGNPTTTKEMIDMVKEKGFQTVRIPVTYYNHIQKDGTIDEKWLARVKEVVDYVIEDDMNCVINIHHDTGDGGWLSADSKNYDTNKERFASMWTQIANYFSAYDNRLIFEGFNEMLNEQKAWDYAGDEAYQTENQWNQLFVDTVRQTGGSNQERYLIVNTYAASVSSDVTSHFQLPKDTVPNHLVVGVHCYKGLNELDAIFSSLKKTFYDQDIPVVMGEFGMSRDKSLEEREEYAAYFQQNAFSNGIAYFWWDEGNYSTNSSSTQDVCNFALLNRVRLEWAYPEIADKLQQ